MLDKRLFYFTQTCKCSSIAEAAEKLYISRQGLSTTLQRFEADVGFALFEKSKTGIRLTPAGRAFAERCERILEEMNDAVEEGKAIAAQSACRISVLCSTLALKRLTLSAIRDFERQCPGASLSISQMMYFAQDFYQPLASGDVDFICGPRVPDLKNFTSLLIAPCKPYLVISRKNPLAKQRVITERDLAGIVLLQRDSYLHLLSKGRTPELRFRFFTNDVFVLSDAIAAGNDGCMLPEDYLFTMDMKKNVAIPIEDGLFDLSLYLSYMGELVGVPLRFAEYLSALSAAKR